MYILNADDILDTTTKSFLQSNVVWVMSHINVRCRSSLCTDFARFDREGSQPRRIRCPDHNDVVCLEIEDRLTLRMTCFVKVCTARFIDFAPLVHSSSYRGQQSLHVMRPSGEWPWIFILMLTNLLDSHFHSWWVNLLGNVTIEAESLSKKILDTCKVTT